MPKKNLIRSRHLPYHVVNRTNRREWFQIPMKEAWSEFQHFCWEASLFNGAKIHAFVLMSNHYHMLLSTPEDDLGDVMQFFSGRSAKSINQRTNHRGHLFSGRYKWSLIDRPDYYFHALKYVYRNPVKAHLTSKVEKYPYSSLHGITGQSHLLFPVTPPKLALDLHSTEEFDPNFVAWLNQPTRTEDEEALQKALARSNFKLPKSRKSREPYELESLPIFNSPKGF